MLNLPSLTNERRRSPMRVLLPLLIAIAVVACQEVVGPTAPEGVPSVTAKREIPPQVKKDSLCRVISKAPNLCFKTVVIHPRLTRLYLQRGDLFGPCSEHFEKLCDDGDPCTVDSVDEGGACCLSEPVECFEGETCVDGSCQNLDQDCVVSDWIEGECGLPCEDVALGTICSTRTILVEPRGDGAPCPDLEECEFCETGLCND